jgi:DNA-directed RNA polymerase, mitochondrial
MAVITISTILELCNRSKYKTQEFISLHYSSISSSISKNLRRQIIQDNLDKLQSELSNHKEKKSENNENPKRANLTPLELKKSIIRIKSNLEYNQKGLNKFVDFLIKQIQECIREFKYLGKNKKPKPIKKIENNKFADKTDSPKRGLISFPKAFLIKMKNRKFLKEGDYFAFLDRTLPMICPPAKWVSYDVGGYLYKKNLLMRIQESSWQASALRRSNLSKIFGVLNVMGETPWRINTKVLKILENLYNLGGGLGSIPIVDKGNQFKNIHNMNYYQKKKLRKQKLDNWSLLSDFEIRLGIARRFKKVERFYLPLSLDFRGRIYPISPHLNQIGNDLSRGLLQFARGKPLGKTGLEWLKIHVANKMGHDKIKISERLEIVEGMIPEIMEMGQNPMKNKTWLEYEDCWQLLAGIIELSEALNHKKPENYISYLHIHQDGSCNGLQHYAALGKDIEGAGQVNLIDKDQPGDLYTAVSERVQKTIDFDSKNGHPVASKLMGYIKRKIVKQTVMTSVYGVTFIGAKNQILKQLKERTKLDEEELISSSAYVANITLKALKDFFQGAQRIKEWFIECARLISKHGYPVSWITSLGLPVIQPYRRNREDLSIKIFLQNVSLIQKKNLLYIDMLKQKSAFPPNFVHSLDSTHLMLTAIEAYNYEIEFAAVHDSFWTHACDVGELNCILREQFVILHSQPLLNSLLEGFQKMYPEIPFQNIPERGELDLSGIVHSKYFFA